MDLAPDAEWRSEPVQIEALKRELQMSKDAFSMALGKKDREILELRRWLGTVRKEVNDMIDEATKENHDES